MFDGQEYEPQNFEHEFTAPVTLRRAMAKSLNVATIKVAEMVGYQTVVNLAHRAGISDDVKATPAMAIGSYVATPLEMAGAYTIFANKGVRVQPTLLSLVKEPNGKVLLDQKPQTKPVLDPRVTYLMVSMLEEVMRTEPPRAFARAGSWFRRPARRARRTTAGSPVLLRTCFASSGSATTITAN